MKTKEGLTIIELLVVIVIIGILGASTTPFLSQFLLRNNHDTTIDKTISSIRKAQEYAIDNKNNETWGICQNVASIRIFTNSCNAPNFQEDFSIPSTVSVIGLNEITFSKNRGEPSSELEIIISTTQESTTIILNQAGGIEKNAGIPSSPSPTPTLFPSPSTTPSPIATPSPAPTTTPSPTPSPSVSPSPSPSPTPPPGKIICTELFVQGLLPIEIYVADKLYGEINAKNDPYVMIGYHYWAQPVVKIMKKSSIFSQVINFLAKPVINEMVYRVGATEEKSMVGNIFLTTGENISRNIGVIKTIND